MKGRMYLKHDYLGIIEITEESDGISGIYFLDEKKEDLEIPSPEVIKCKKELEEYFKKKRTEFTINIDFKGGTEFQKACWKAMHKIPYGKTISYSEEAQYIDNPKAVRAVGGANGKNPISIVVPWHRVIGKSGKLTGFGAGIWRKEYLLKLEK